jgi:glycosyltransferase involved in cell wall biosynthesis
MARHGIQGPVNSVLHVLPHRGGGGETYVDLLEGLRALRHERAYLSRERSPVAGAPSIAARWPGIAVRARRAGIVHAHGDVAAALALPLLRARPSVWTTHGLHFLRRADGPALRMARAAVRGAVAASARTICTSAAERDELVRLVSPALHERLVVVRNGILPPPPLAAAERAAARAGLGLADGEVAALFLGELEARKGPLVAIEAAERARDRGAPLVLLVAGDGPQAAQVAARASGGVRVLGHRDDVPVLLAAAEILVMPSEREGLSFAVLEAMGRGLAMVVSDGPGNPEAVGDAGVVVPVGDPEALAVALAGLAGDPGERARLGAAARERIASELTLDALLAGVEGAYRAARAR